METRTTEAKLPDGFIYVPEFLTEHEENVLLNEISRLELHTFIFQGYEAKRKVASFGYDYSFDSRSLSKGQAILGAFDFLLKKVADHLSLSPNDFAELLVTEYPVGSVINWHRDAPPFDKIVG